MQNNSNNEPLLKSVTPPPFKLQLGLNYCTNEQHHSDASILSSSLLKIINESLEKFHDEVILGNKKEPKNKGALVVGSLTHTMIMEPHMVNKEYLFTSAWDRRSKEYKDFVSSADPRDKRSIVTLTEQNLVNRLVAVYKKHPVAPQYFKGGKAELTLVCVYNLKTGAISFSEADESKDTVRLKVRFDYINEHEGYITDVKTTGYSSDFETFKITAENLEYDLSAALYLMVAEAYFKRPFKFYFCVLSKKDITCDLHGTSLNTRIKGQQKVVKALNKYKQARETGIWTESSPSLLVNESTDYEIREI